METMQRFTVGCLIAVLGVAAAARGASPWGLHQAERDDGKPRVLLIGDSIMIGYRRFVAAELGPGVVVDDWATSVHIACKGVTQELEKILAARAYDVIHFNHGLHGFGDRIPAGQYPVLLRQYAKRLKELAPTATIIWASTTPVWMKDSDTQLDESPAWNGLVRSRNAMAAEIMAEEGILVNDLYSVCLREPGLAKGDRMHYNPRGQEVQGRHIAATIRRSLPEGADWRPAFAVARVPPGQVTVDGRIVADEWNGATPGQAMVLQTDVNGQSTALRSLAWLIHDGSALYVAVDNLVDPWVALRTGTNWGQDDAVEIAIKCPSAGGTADVVVLRGYTDGTFESSGEAGAPGAVVARSAQGVAYGVGKAESGRWSAEWRVPFDALGVKPSIHRRLPFSLSVRKTANGLWLMWVATRAHTWDVDKAGSIELQ